jgi:hypothetical protein
MEVHASHEKIGPPRFEKSSFGSDDQHLAESGTEMYRSGPFRAVPGRSGPFRAVPVPSGPFPLLECNPSRFFNRNGGAMSDTLSDHQRLIVGRLLMKAKEKPILDENGKQILKNDGEPKTRTNDEIAHEARTGEKTVRQALEGHCKNNKTLERIAGVLGVDFETACNFARMSDFEHHLGRHSEADHKHLFGKHATIRPTYDGSSRIKCFFTKITWDNVLECVYFEDLSRDDGRNNQGYISIKTYCEYIYLISLNDNFIRTIVLSKPSPDYRILAGEIFSQRRIFTDRYEPVSAPIIYLPQKHQNWPKTAGIIKDGKDYKVYCDLLDQASFKRFGSPKPFLRPSIDATDTI